MSSSPINIPIDLDSEIKCRTCMKVFRPSPDASFLFRDLCVPCQVAFEANMAALDNGQASTSSSRLQQEENSNEEEEEKSPDNVVEREAVEKVVEPPFVNQYDSARFDQNEEENRNDMDVVQQNVGQTLVVDRGSSSSSDSPTVSLEVMLGSVLACGAHAGQIFLNNIPYLVEAEKLNIPEGRGAGTTMFHNEYSKKLPELYWYRFYAGFSTQKYQCMGICMTKCGNIFIGVMETMCSAPRMDPVIYFSSTKSAKIIKTPQWRRQYILDPSAELTTDVDDVNRYVFLVFLCYCIANAYIYKIQYI